MTNLIQRLAVAAFLLLAAWRAAAGGPADSTGEPVPPAGRTWAMGFGTVPPRPTVAAAVQAIDLWSRRAEIAAIHEELPWQELLGGTPPDAILDRHKEGLIKYLHSKGLKIFFMADPNDGLARGREAPQLRALGRSLAEPEVRDAYRRYVAAFARRYRPEYIGLAAETNLVRALAPPALYAAVRQAANDTAADLRAAGSTAVLLTSVQVETAWGKLPGAPVAGIAQDLADFPFGQMLGLSAYPYLAYRTPEEIPDDYFRRVLRDCALPVMIVEGGWTSAAVGPVRSSPELQARYLTRLAQLADGVRARGLIQLLFADLDLASFPGGLPAAMPLFAAIGFVDADLRPKPALEVWDRLQRRKLLP